MPHFRICGVVDEECIAEAANARSSDFVDQNVCLRQDMCAGYATRLYRKDGARTVWKSSWTMFNWCMLSRHMAIPISCHREASEDLYLGECNGAITSCNFFTSDRDSLRYCLRSEPSMYS